MTTLVLNDYRYQMADRMNTVLGLSEGFHGGFKGPLSDRERKAVSILGSCARKLRKDLELLKSVLEPHSV